MPLTEWKIENMLFWVRDKRFLTGKQTKAQAAVPPFRLQAYVNDPSDPVVREFLGEDTPPIADLIRNTSLVMVNNHFSVNPARPVNPNVINVGGLHLKARPNKNIA